MFLAANHWATIRYQYSTKTPLEFLLDITLHIPGLLERGDQIKLLGSREGEDTHDQGHSKGCYFQSARCNQAVEYLQDCDSLIQNLYDWLESLQQSDKRPLWWYSEASTLTARKPPSRPGQLVDPDGRSKAHQLSTIHFSSPRIPGLLIHYWTALLELSRAILEVRNLFLHDTLYATYYEVLGIDSPSMTIDEDRPSKLALRICQTVMHLGSSLEGCTIIYVPAQRAENYFTRLLTDECQRGWGEDSDRLRNYERAQIGLECSKKAVAMLQNALQNYH